MGNLYQHTHLASHNAYGDHEKKYASGDTKTSGDRMDIDEEFTARSIIIGELRFSFARRGLNGCLGRLGHACRVLLGQGNHLHNPDLVGTKGIMVL